MKSKIILIGPLNKNKVPCTGDTVKNQLFVKRFSEVYDSIIVVDTYHWKKRPWCLCEMLFNIFWYKNSKVIISTNPGSADVLIKLLYHLRQSARTFYWVVGGSLHKSFESGIYNPYYYKDLAGIFVQGVSMVDSLGEIGLSNARYVSNSKYIENIPAPHKKVSQPIHFVFLSRIEKYKGCDDIFSAIEILNRRGYQGKYDVTFYGKTTDELSYFRIFEDQVARFSDVKYSGVLNLRDPQKYAELASFDIMLFPTYWPGEGFPGAIIDAYIAGLPVIASDWNLNKDVVKENFTGWIIPTHDTEKLAEVMMYAIDHPEKILEYSGNSRKEALKYDSRNVLSEKNLKTLGLL